MLFVVLVLVLAAAALLVTALVNGAMLWAWLSVGVSVVAAIVLLVDWARRRTAVRDTPPVQAAAPATVQAAAPATEQAPVEAAPAESPADSSADPSAGDAEPAEEDTDAADLLVVTDLATEVRVLDERPRYHLAACAWLAGRPTLGLPVSEARQLGFTPCAVCLPDSTLAAAARTAG